MTDEQFNERIEALSRHEALTMSVDLMTREIALRARRDELVTAAEKDGENLRALARIAEIHERRLSNPETE